MADYESIFDIGLSHHVTKAANSLPQILNLGLKFEIIPSPFDEEKVKKDSYQNPKDYVKYLAHHKALAVAEQFKDCEDKVLVIGADTVIIHDGKIIGKPHTPEVAVATLQKLNNKVHTVCTGVSMIQVDEERFSEAIFDETTAVEFGKLSTSEIEGYVSTGEPLNKAGAYGIQGLGAVLVQRINGDYNNVVGFPAFKFCQELRMFLRGDRNSSEM